MMLGDEVPYLRRETVFSRQFQAVGYVAQNDLGAATEVQLVVGVASRQLVFNVVAGLLQLANVVEVAADTDGRESAPMRSAARSARLPRITL